MNILFLNAYYEPEIFSSSYLVNNLTEALVKEGFHVSVFAPVPSRGVSNDVRRQYKKIRVEKLYDGRLKVHRFSMFKEGGNVIGRAFRYFYLNLKLFFKGLFTKTDLIFLYSTPPIQGMMGAVLKFFKRVPFVYNLQDIFPDSMISAGITSKKSFIYKIGRRIENVSYKSADKIIVISESFKENIIKKGVPEEKIEIVYNWVDENEVTHIERKDNPIFDMLQIPRDGFYVCYAGNIGLLQNLSTLIDAAEILQNKEPQIKFVIIGNGAWKPEMLNQIDEKQLNNVMTFPMQDTKYVPYVYNLGDIGIVTIAKDVSKSALPSKTWNILSASRPVICEVDEGSELEHIITENKCGLCVVPGDSEGLADKILTLYNDREMIMSMGGNGRKFIEDNITRKKSTQKILDCIVKVKKEN